MLSKHSLRNTKPIVRSRLCRLTNSIPVRIRICKSHIHTRKLYHRRNPHEVRTTSSHTYVRPVSQLGSVTGMWEADGCFCFMILRGNRDFACDLHTIGSSQPQTSETCGGGKTGKGNKGSPALRPRPALSRFHMYVCRGPCICLLT